jgi:hypothetical protein
VRLVVASGAVRDVGKDTSETLHCTVALALIVR